MFDLVSLKAEIDELVIGKLVPVRVDLCKLSDVVQNVVEKTINDKLVAKVNNIDISGLVLKTKYETEKWDFEKKISDADKKLLILEDLLNKQIIMLRLLN